MAIWLEVCYVCKAACRRYDLVADPPSVLSKHPSGSGGGVRAAHVTHPPAPGAPASSRLASPPPMQAMQTEAADERGDSGRGRGRKRKRWEMESEREREREREREGKGKRKRKGREGKGKGERKEKRKRKGKRKRKRKGKRNRKRREIFSKIPVSLARSMVMSCDCLVGVKKEHTIASSQPRAMSFCSLE